jgi:hypothetical protein
VESLVLHLDNCNPDAIELLQVVVASKVRNFELFIEDGNNKKLSDAVFEALCQFVRSFSNQLCFVRINGACSYNRIIVLTQSLLENLSPIRFGVSLDVKTNFPHRIEIANLIKRDPRISMVDDLFGTVESWTDGWSTQNVLQSINLRSWDKLNSNIIGRLLSNCPCLSSVRLFGRVGEKSFKIEDILDSISMKSSLECLEIAIVDKRLDVFALIGVPSEILSNFKCLKKLVIPQFFGDDLQSKSLQELKCSTTLYPSQDNSQDTTCILTSNPNLQSLEISQCFWISREGSVHSGDKLNISSLLKNLPFNQVLVSLSLPDKVHFHEDFELLFQLLRQNATLSYLKATISLDSVRQLKAVSEYLESNSGGLEFLDLRKPERISCQTFKYQQECLQILQALSINTHILSFGIKSLIFPEDAVLSCISLNTKLIDISCSPTTPAVQKALTKNRNPFQKTCRLALIRKVFSTLSNNILEINVLQEIFKMSAHNLIPDIDLLQDTAEVENGGLSF